ncbi:elongation factor 1-gamma-like [Orycteropus afer afer]|uniref:Elongation factor 1-gamma-like n=1 Tax=Orycteropus afer afer TaxID=1230840 RepID=A0A8B7AW81_ORYAF|nr:elongation factor 1-gamma-like [Orycteropus afer afer]
MSLIVFPNLCSLIRRRGTHFALFPDNFWWPESHRPSPARGSSPETAAQVVQWVSFANSNIVAPASTCVFPTLGIMNHNKQATENAKEEVRQILGLLNAHLKMRTFLVGERVTLADITVVCTLLWLYKQVLELSFCQAFPNTNRWFLTCINQPQFWTILGEVKLCEKMAQFGAKKFAESQPKKDTPLSM